MSCCEKARGSRSGDECGLIFQKSSWQSSKSGSLQMTNLGPSGAQSYLKTINIDGKYPWGPFGKTRENFRPVQRQLTVLRQLSQSNELLFHRTVSQYSKPQAKR